MKIKKQRGKPKVTYADLLNKLIEENKRLIKENQELKNKLKELSQANKKAQ